MELLPWHAPLGKTPQGAMTWLAWGLAIEESAIHSANTCTWGKVHQADMVLSRHANIYQKCRKAMVSLQADETLLERYKALDNQDLKVTTAIANPNGSAHHMADLAWFWTMDIP
ncbi:hypothetical protein BS17DRAFT_770056 [Gyrodon lividus]|nr:hypothetical protein BS17DRAFT_770056 [Gyrodon lividus]